MNLNMLLEKEKETPFQSLSYKDIVTCAFCQSTSLIEVLDLGHVALAGAFLKPNQILEEEKFPLRVHFCTECFATQVVDKINPKTMFSNYFYYSSQINTLKHHFENYASEVVKRFLSNPSHSTILEFGCNDGVLLRPLLKQNIGTLIGVDPATNILESISDQRIHLINNFFTENVADNLLDRFGKVDMILANNVFAHIADICGTTRAIRQLLKDDGVFIFEVHYLGNIIQELQYDMIYHEHLYYHSYHSLEKHFNAHDMMIFDVKRVPIHGGSIRYYACKKNSIHAHPSDHVLSIKKEEKDAGYLYPETYEKFARNVNEKRDQLMEIISNVRGKGQRIAGYGASGRANTIIQYCGINHDHLDYMIDDSTAKHGFLTPGSHFPIFSNSILKTAPPDYLLVFAWSFINEISAKCKTYMENGGKLLLPLPKVRVIGES